MIRLDDGTDKLVARSELVSTYVHGVQ